MRDANYEKIFPVVEKVLRAQVQKAGLANSEIMHSEMSNSVFSFRTADQS